MFSRPGGRLVGWIRVTVTILSLLALEGALRAYYWWVAPPAVRYRVALFAGDQLPGMRPRYRSHPYLSYALSPYFTDATGLTHHNGFGLRGAAEVQPRDSSTVRIIAIGGSTTYTVKVDDDSLTYPSQLERDLRTMTGNQHIEVLNAGVPGYTSWESLIDLCIRLLALQPDVLVIYQGGNDIHALCAPEYTTDNTGYRRAWGERLTFPLRILKCSFIARTLAVYVGGVRSLGVEHYTLTDLSLIQKCPPADRRPVYFRRNIELMVQVARANGIRVALCTSPSNRLFPGHYASSECYQLALSEVNDVVRSICLQERLPCADLAEAMPQDPSLWLDGVHFNAQGAGVAAQIIARSIVQGGIVPAARKEEPH